MTAHYKAHNKSLKSGGTGLVIAAALTFASAASAQDIPSAAAADVQDEVILEAGAVQGNSGHIAVNGAAGTGNQQIASATLAVGEFTSSVQAASQFVIADDDSDRSTHIMISDGAFAGNSGLLSLNISAGNYNQSANLAQLSAGEFGVLSDELLEQSYAATRPNGDLGGDATLRNDSVEIGENAFRDNSGLVQINLIGGERNSSANTFQLSILAGSTP